MATEAGITQRPLADNGAYLGADNASIKPKANTQFGGQTNRPSPIYVHIFINIFISVYAARYRRKKYIYKYMGII